MSRKQKTRILLGMLVLFGFLTAGVSIQEPEPPPSADEINAIAKNMYCPVCQSTPLDVCGTLVCQQWREEIGLLLADGYTEDEIYDYFVQRHGDRVLAVPPPTGLTLVAYILPPVVLLIALFFLFRLYKNYRLQAPQIGALNKASDQNISNDEYIQRLEEQLEQREG